MAWVAVNKDGSEKMYSVEPKRCETMWDEFLGPDNSFAIVLSKGTIKKLIDRDFTWEGDAVELKRRIVMKEVKIQIPDNCELIKDGDTYVVKEKKQKPPRSWEEFCKRFPLKNGEAYIEPDSTIGVANYKSSRNVSGGKNWCTSKEEAEAFLALMQLRQLRKAWVGDWKITGQLYYCIIPSKTKITVMDNFSVLRSLSFPTQSMAYDFLNCFRDLCETAKMLL